MGCGSCAAGLHTRPAGADTGAATSPMATPKATMAFMDKSLSSPPVISQMSGLFCHEQVPTDYRRPRVTIQKLFDTTRQLGTQAQLEGSERG